jgi:hypothetical protein
MTDVDQNSVFRISLFGLPAQDFGFSRAEIDKMRGFKDEFECLLTTDFMRKKMYRIPYVLAGSVRKVITPTAWRDFLTVLRHLVGGKHEDFGYKKARDIAFKKPLGADFPEVIDAIDKQKAAADDAFHNDGEFGFERLSPEAAASLEAIFSSGGRGPAAPIHGEVISGWNMLENYAYTYTHHRQRKHEPLLDSFGLTRDNHNAKAQFSFCLMVKVIAFQRLYDHVCDILHFIDNPNQRIEDYAFRSRVCSTDSFVEERLASSCWINGTKGFASLGSYPNGPYTPIGPVEVTVTQRVLEKTTWEYIKGVHHRTNVVPEVKGLEAHLRLRSPSGIDRVREILKLSTGLTVRADNLSIAAKVLSRRLLKGGTEVKLRLDLKNQQCLYGEMLGPIPEFLKGAHGEEQAASIVSAKPHQS